jgi:anti-sigma regulatory factor (Ser/Thr protein kinase)
MARQWLTWSIAGAVESGELDRTKLLVSELVTNALVHGRGKIVARAHLDDQLLRVEVSDEGTGVTPAVQARDPDGLHGRGLALVEAEASRWGVRADTTRVWFELDRRRARRRLR